MSEPTTAGTVDRRSQPQYTGAPGAQDRSVSPYSTRHRAHFNFDSRTQTAYGTLRTYVAVHIENENQGTVTVNPTRAFIQWAGFTFGHTKSFTDVPGTPGADTLQVAVPEPEHQRYRRQRHQPDRLYLGARQWHDAQRRCRRAAHQGDRQPVEQRATVGANPATAFGPVSASDPVGELRGQPGLGPVWRVGDLQQGQRNLLQRCGRHPGDLGYR